MFYVTSIWTFTSEAAPVSAATTFVNTHTATRLQFGGFNKVCMALFAMSSLLKIKGHF